MPVTDYKKLHKEWKKAKENAKIAYEGWARLNTDLSNAHEDVKFDIPTFPKFNLDLGPSLDDIEKKKNVDKNKIKAIKAVEQYKKDIKGLSEAVKKDKKNKNESKLLSDDLDTLEKVRDDIEKALGEL